MKKVFLWVTTMFASLTLNIANIGAGLASGGGWHQPKVPERLIKK